MKQSRRDFFKIAGIIGAGLAGVKPEKANAAPKNVISDDRMGVLVDTTLCVGCRRCEYACKEAHGIEAGSLDDYDDRSVFKKMRRPDAGALTVVNEFENDEASGLPINVKVQCMHCDHPACVSACIVGALSKQENGAVIWNGDKCIGCRYCVVACPFQIPAFEYHKAIEPDIVKCDFCYERTSKGGIPACVEACPMEALTYGKRFDLIKLAHNRINADPDNYIDHVYGEHEVGGTSWMYLASKDFSELALPEHGSEPMPGASESLQHGIFKYFIPPASLYALLGGIMWLGKKKEKSELGE
ncbi:MAG: 4Fe-4S dicluster domain-containing protein [Calditrichaceae bacterium]|nr:4Fe-4S dicluster domain-containing protein [Calditrichaceae bacterium]MBN2710604.1 4Fe-4S dicluster domain-containing protein [Calditrichaceae bacterium]RQV96784.1 MAG: 4Fe-4S dicluster domain-containing protein [Calditrichota bacterium]